MPPGKLPSRLRSNSIPYHSIPLVLIARLLRMVSRLVGAGGRSAGSQQTGGRAERGARSGRRGGGVGGRGAGHRHPAQQADGSRSGHDEGPLNGGPHLCMRGLEREMGLEPTTLCLGSTLVAPPSPGRSNG